MDSFKRYVIGATGTLVVCLLMLYASMSHAAMPPISLGGSTSTSTSAINSIPGVINWGPQQLPHMIADIAGVTSLGTKVSARWVIASDSTGAGHCADGACVDNRLHSWSYQLAASMNVSGIPTSVDSFWGCSNEASITLCKSLDSRVNFGAGWIQLNQTALGGYVPQFPANTTPTAMTLQFAGAYNQADVYLINGTAASSFTVTQGATNPSSSSVINTTGTACTVSGQTITTSAGTTGECEVRFNFTATTTDLVTIQASSSSTGRFYVGAVAVRDTANPKIELYNQSIGGSSSNDWASTTGIGVYGPLVGIKFSAPTVTFVAHGINDWATGTPTTIPTYTANLNTIFTAAALTGDVVDIFEIQSDPVQTGVSVATQQTYDTAARSFNLPHIDFQYRWGTWAKASALCFIGGSTCTDSRHGSAKGYSDEGNYIFSAISGISGGGSYGLASSYGLVTNTSLNTSPTISSGFGTSPSIVKSNGTAAFVINVGSGGTASSGVVGMPAAANGWSCEVNDITTKSTAVNNSEVTATTTTSVTVGNFTNLIVLGAWAANDNLQFQCVAY